MQGDQLKMDSGAPPCYGDNTLQPPKSHTTGCSTKVALLCTLKRRATGQSVHLIQHRSSKGQTGTLSPSSATDCSSSPVDCQTVSFSSKFRFFFFFPELRRMFYLQLQQCARDYHHKSYFHLVRWLFFTTHHGASWH